MEQDDKDLGRLPVSAYADPVTASPMLRTEPATLSPPSGSVPHGAGVLLHHPKFLDNLGRVARIAACYGVEDVWYSGNRVSFEVDRLPRELRLPAYRRSHPRPLHNYRGALASAPRIPVAVEITDGAETLCAFEHPERAFYVFGPEDGSLPQDVLRLCHRFVRIPTQHCLSLPVALATVLYDRACKAREASQ